MVRTYRNVARRLGHGDSRKFWDDKSNPTITVPERMKSDVRNCSPAYMRALSAVNFLELMEKETRQKLMAALHNIHLLSKAGDWVSVQIDEISLQTLEKIKVIERNPENPSVVGCTLTGEKVLNIFDCRKI